METLAALGIGALLLLFCWWALSGIIVGAIARFLLPGSDSMGWGKTILIGIVGSWVGGLLGRLTHLNEKAPDFVFSIAGAMILLLILRMRR